MVHHELFDPLVHVAGEVVWEFRDGDVRWHDSPYRRSMGLEEVFATNSLDMWGSRLHADDAERVLSRLRTALHTVGVPWTDEYRLRRDDGEYAILEVRGYTLPSDDDHPSLTVGTVRDVTQERENERRLKDALTYADTLIQSIPGAVYHVTHDDLVMFRWNEWFAKVSGYTDEELAVLPAMRLFAEDEQGKVAEAIAGILNHDVGDGQITADFVSKDGTRRPYLWTGRRLVHDGQLGFIGVAIDMTEQEELRAKLQSAADYATALIDSIPGAFYHVTRDDLLMQRWNAAFREITGYTDEELATMTAGEFFGEDEQEKVAAAIDDIFTTGYGQVSADFLCKDGTRKPYFFTGRPFLHEGRQSYVGVALAMDEQAALQAQLRHAATHDGLTGLANRSLLQEKLEQAIAAAESGRHMVAVLDLDLDRFKVVNDGFGHPFGDKVLQAVAQRLRTLVCAADTVVRMGGDEFVIVVPYVERVEDIHEMAQRLVDSFAEPFVVEGRQIHLTGSIGVGFYPRDGQHGAELIDNADMAMYYAKAAGRSAFRVFAPVMAEEALRRTDMETHLRTAAVDGQLWLAFQPKIDVASATVTGCEALLRWNHPERGPIPPSEFIPVAEESGMIVQIGEWVLEEACRQGRAWLDEGIAPMTIAVNLSAAQLLQPDPVGWVTSTLERTGFPAELLELELTESQLAQDVDTTIGVIRRLRALGVQVAIDDFGTGYSSLEYLRRFDVTSLKIDRSFVDGMLTESSDAAIVRAAIALGGAFGISVTAEGVETEAQQRFLSELRCDEMQGYLVSKPVAADEFSALLERWTPPSA